MRQGTETTAQGKRRQGADRILIVGVRLACKVKIGNWNHAFSEIAIVLNPLEKWLALRWALLPYPKTLLATDIEQSMLPPQMAASQKNS